MRLMRNKNSETRTSVHAGWQRLRVAATVVALIWGTHGAAAQVSTTTVQGTIYRADGTPASGSVLVSWGAFTTPQNQAVAAGSESAAIGSDGFLSVNLTPNAGALPSGSYYTAVYHLSDGTVYPEYWVVPASGTVSVAAVRAQLEPSTVAVASAVTPSYVQGALASLSSTYLPLAGGTLTGTLTLSGDPSGLNQAATKHYVDQTAAQALPASGGALTGPLSVPSLSTKLLEGRHYADEWQSSSGSNNGIALSVQDCASFPYACEVLAPALYMQTEAEPWGGAYQWSGASTAPKAVTGPAYGQPVGCVEDDRFGGPQWVCNGAYPSPSWATTGVAGPVNGPSFTVYNTQHISAAYNAVPPALTLSGYNFAGTEYNRFQAQFPALNLVQVNDALSQSAGIALWQYANSNGDTMPIQIDHFQRGGLSTGDSEGAENRIVMQEAPDVYRGTISGMTNQTGASNTCQGPCTIFSTTQTQGYPGSLGDGLEVVDLSQADSTGYISVIGIGAAVTCTACDWDTKYGDSAAHTTTTASLTGAPTNPLQPPTSVCVPVDDSTGFTVGGNAFLVDASGTFWENEPITAINSSSCGSNTLTLAVLRQDFSIGSSVAEGGMAGMGIEFPADEVGPSAMNGQWANVNPTSVIRTVWPIAYNVAGGTLYGPASNEGHSFGKNYNTLAYSQMGSGGSVSCTMSSGSIAGCTASGGIGYLNFNSTSNYQASPQLSISGLTCTTDPVIYISATSGGALSTVGIANAGAGCTGTPTITVTPTNGYAVYPMARTLNVWNPATGKVDGSSIATDIPAGTFNNGDTLEQEHYPIEDYHLGNEVVAGFQGGSYSNALTLQWGGRNSAQSFFQLNNNNAPALYSGYPAGATPWALGQGQMITPTGLSLWGSWGTGIYLQQPPFGNNPGISSGVISVGCNVRGVNVCAGWNAWSVLLNHANQQSNGSASDVLEYNPSTAAWQWTAGAGGPSGAGAGCTLNFNTGGLSGNCAGQLWNFDASGDLTLSGSLHAKAGVTGATINGEITVDGTTYPTLNAAWNAAATQANATGQNQTIRLGPGNYLVSATLAEPSSGVCVNVIGSAGTTMNADSPQVATTISVSNSLGGDLFSLGNAQQAQGCTFQNLNILANGNAVHGFEFQWFRGLLIDNVTVNDTSSDGIVLGEETTGHQSSFLLRNVTVSYSTTAFTPANRPNYGIHLEKTAIDSALDEITVRNALTAAVYNEGTGNTGYLIHGFGYPYTCTTAPCVNNASSASAANASYATSYVIYDTGGGGSEWTDTYVDSPAIAGFYIGANGVSVEGGHIQWPDLTSFPAANLAYVASNVSNNLLIGDVSCLGMASGANWITYSGASGNPPSFSSVHHLTGCGNYYQALEPAVTTGFSSGGANINDPTGAVPRVWATPLASSSSDAAYSAQMYTGYQGDVFQAHFSGVNPFFNITYQGTIRSSGGLALSTVINSSSTLTLTAANKNVIANAASGPQTITLPSCYTQLPDKSSPTGLEFTIIKSDTSSNAVTLQTVSSQNINYNGVSAQTLAIASPGKRTLVCAPDYNWYAY